MLVCQSLGARLHGAVQMLYLRYSVGGQAELNAADCVSLDDMVTAQEGGALTLSMMLLLQSYLIEAMRELKVDEASKLECRAWMLRPSEGVAAAAGHEAVSHSSLAPLKGC